MSVRDLSRDYQVFLSFRGLDTGRGFTDTLYQCLMNEGIRVFKDDDDDDYGQLVGEKIEKIMDTIDGSVICIPIFSTGYASSKRCLRELARMMFQNKIIVPIFYDVMPADVKLQTNLYTNALKKHHQEPENVDGAEMEPRTNSREGSALEVQQWTESLKKVARVTGRELWNTGHDTFCKSVTKEILIKLKVKQKVVPDRLVGMDDHVKAVIELLDIDACDVVRYVGIHGIGGTGKTTLAKVVYNKLCYQFDRCCFISDIKEKSKRHGITHLQMQLLSDIHGMTREVTDSGNGIKAIKAMGQNKRTLLVLDDVDQRDQIEKLAGKSSWFGSGSRIIVTTRDVRVMATDQALLREGVLKQSGEVKTFEMELSSVQTPKHLNICKEKLEDTYNELDYRAQQIFLDIACFLIDKEKSSAIYMWDDCKLFPSIWLEELISMSLVRIVDCDKLWMHDYVRDQGRKVVRKDLGEQSRLWKHEEAFGILEGEEGTEKVEAMCISDDEQLEGKCFGIEAFEYLKNLRFLEWHRLNFDGDFKGLLTKLRWLSWHSCPAEFRATNLELSNLVILDLSWSEISEMWEGWSQIKIGAKLKVINLMGCKNLSRTPNLSKYTTLERLVLENCKFLISIDSSIGKCKKLKHLNIKGCDSLRCLPDEMRSLKVLEEFVLNGKSHALLDMPLLPKTTRLVT